MVVFFYLHIKYKMAFVNKIDTLQGLSAIPYRVINIGNGSIATKNTLKLMIQIINEGSKNIYVRRWAEHIIKNIPQYRWLDEAKAIHNFVRDNVRYTRDPDSVEYLQTPDTLLQQIERNSYASGDCDDSVVLALSLAKSVGFPVALRIASYTPDKEFSHVYGLIKVGNDWISTDCIKNNLQLGFEAPNATAIHTEEI